jgi:hypothetical protein
VLKFDTSSFGCELPVCLGVMRVAVVLPGGDFVDEGLFVGDRAIKTLSGKDGEFGFREVEPTAMFGRVVPLEALDQPSCLGGGESFVK